jgi:hypothetical protein
VTIEPPSDSDHRPRTYWAAIEATVTAVKRGQMPRENALRVIAAIVDDAREEGVMARG